MSDERFRPVNQMLGARPSLGPVPADLALPWGGITVLVLIFTRSVFVLDWTWTIGLIVWGCTTWAVLTGTKPYKYLSKFYSPPNRWSRGHGRYKPMLGRRRVRSRSGSGRGSRSATEWSRSRGRR